MSASAPPRLQPYVVGDGLQGQLGEIALPEILQHLRTTGATGILTVVSGGARKAIYFKDGHVVFATSNLPNDRLGEMLLREGKITVEEYESSIKALSKGKRQGKVLVEMGALSPKDLWEGVQLQVEEIVHSAFQWEDGQFVFEATARPEKERITVDLDVRRLILTGIRRVDSAGPIKERFPERSAILEDLASEGSEGIEAYEQHVRDLVDGERSVLDICRESEIGDAETQKVLYSLLAAGFVRVKGRKVHTLDQDFVQEDTLYSVVESFNQKYTQIFKYMVQEVGPIAENVLEKYVAGLREARKEVFGDIALEKDGSVDSAALERNLDRFPDAERRPLLVDSLNELLYAELLAVKRTLGSEHEATLIQAIREP